MIEIKNLYVKELNFNLTFDIPSGITYLKGKNGSGKTIFLDYLCSIRKDKDGNITGNDNLVYLRQNFAMYKRITTSEFIKFVYDIDDVKLEKFFNFINEKNLSFDFKKIKNTKLGLLSGGERRLLYLLVLLSLDKDIYVLDEPFANLDKETKSEILDLITELNSEGKNFIITNHEESEKFDSILTQTIDFEEVKHVE